MTSLNSPKSPLLARTVARLCLIACGLASSCAGAVHLSPDDTGQVILVPFYTVRNGLIPSITIVNRSMNHAKVIKVQFREAIIGASVMDLNVFLPSRDVWTATLSDDGAGARLVSTDRSCTNPAIPVGGAAFTNRYYTGEAPGTFNDGAGDSLDRTRDGFIEIIEMGVIADGSDASASPHTETGRQLSAAVRQNIEGLPSNCETVRVSNPFASSGDLRAPTGELSAGTILIQAETGSEFVIPSTSLQRFFVPTNLQDDLYTPPGSTLPDLTSVHPARSDVLTMRRDEPVILTVPDWVAAGGQAVDAVSAVLMKSSFSAEYDVSSTQIHSELVVTMPTMRHYVLPASPEQRSLFIVRGPFAEQFFSPSNGQSPGDSRACNRFLAFASDREAAPYARLSSSFENFNVCSVVNRVAVIPSGSRTSDSLVFGLGPRFGGFILPSSAPSGRAPQYVSGWVELMPTNRSTTESAFGPGQLANLEDNSVSYRPGLVRRIDNAGGLGNIAPLHSDGIARRYRGLPVIGFTSIQAIVGGQGYGGIFGLKGSPNPTP